MLSTKVVLLLLLGVLLFPTTSDAAVTNITCAATVTVTSTSNNKELQLVDCIGRVVALTIRSTSNVVLTVLNVTLSSILLDGNTNLRLQVLNATNQRGTFGRPFLSINGTETRLSLLVNNTNISTERASAVYSGPLTTTSRKCQTCSLTFIRTRIATIFREAVYIAQLLDSNLTLGDGTFVNVTLGTFQLQAYNPDSLVVEKATSKTIVTLSSMRYLVTGTAGPNIHMPLTALAFPSWTSGGSVSVVDSTVTMQSFVTGTSYVAFGYSCINGVFTGAVISFNRSHYIATATVLSSAPPDPYVAQLNFDSSLIGTATIGGSSVVYVTASRISALPTSFSKSTMSSASFLGTDVTLNSPSRVVIDGNFVEFYKTTYSQTSRYVRLTYATVNSGATLTIENNNIYISWSSAFWMGLMGGTIKTGARVRIVNNTVSHEAKTAVTISGVQTDELAAPVLIVYNFLGSNATLNPYNPAVVCASANFPATSALLCGNSFLSSATTTAEFKLAETITMQRQSAMEWNVAHFGVTSTYVTLMWLYEVTYMTSSAIRHNYANFTRVPSVLYYPFGLQTPDQLVLTGNTINAYGALYPTRLGLASHPSWCVTGSEICNNTMIVAAASFVYIRFLFLTPKLSAGRMQVRENVVNAIAVPTLFYDLVSNHVVKDSYNLTVVNNTLLVVNGSTTVNLLAYAAPVNTNVMVRNNVMLMFGNFSTQDLLPDASRVFPLSCFPDQNRQERFFVCNNSVLATSATSVTYNLVSVLSDAAAVVTVRDNFVYAAYVQTLRYTLLAGGKIFGINTASNNLVAVRNASVLSVVFVAATEFASGSTTRVANNRVDSANVTQLETQITSFVTTSVPMVLSLNAFVAVPRVESINAPFVDVRRSGTTCPTSTSTRGVVCNNTVISTGTTNSFHPTLVNSLRSTFSAAPTGVVEVIDNVVFSIDVSSVSAALGTTVAQSQHSFFRVANNMIALRNSQSVSWAMYGHQSHTGKSLVQGNLAVATNATLPSLQPVNTVCPTASVAGKQSVTCNNTFIADAVVTHVGHVLISTWSWATASGPEVQIFNNSFRSANISSVAVVMLQGASEAKSIANISGNAAVVANANTFSCTLINGMSSQAGNVSIVGNEIVVNTSVGGTQRPAGYTRPRCNVPTAAWVQGGAGVTLVCGNTVAVTNDVTSGLHNNIAVTLWKSGGQSTGTLTFVRANWISLSTLATTNSMMLVDTFTHSGNNAVLTIAGNVVQISRSTEGLAATRLTGALLTVCFTCKVNTVLVSSNLIAVDGLRSSAEVRTTLFDKPQGGGSTVPAHNLTVTNNTFVYGTTSALVANVALNGITGYVATSRVPPHILFSANSISIITSTEVVTSPRSAVVVLVSQLTSVSTGTFGSVTRNTLSLTSAMATVQMYSAVATTFAGAGNVSATYNRIVVNATIASLVFFVASSVPRSPMLVHFNTISVAPLLTGPTAASYSNATVAFFFNSAPFWNASDNAVAARDVHQFSFAAHNVSGMFPNNSIVFTRNSVSAHNIRNATAVHVYFRPPTALSLFIFSVADNTIAATDTSRLSFAVLQHDSTTNFGVCSIVGNKVDAIRVTDVDLRVVAVRTLSSAVGLRVLRNRLVAAMREAAVLTSMSMLLLQSTQAASAVNSSFDLMDNVLALHNVRLAATTVCNVALAATLLNGGSGCRFTATNNSISVLSFPSSTSGSDDTLRFAQRSSAILSGIRLQGWTAAPSAPLIAQTRLVYNASVEKLTVALFALALSGSSVSMDSFSNAIAVSGNISSASVSVLDASTFLLPYLRFNDNSVTVADSVRSVAVAFLRLHSSTAATGVSATANVIDVQATTVNGSVFEFGGGRACVSEVNASGFSYVSGSALARTALVNSSACPIAFTRNQVHIPTNISTVTLVSVLYGTTDVTLSRVNLSHTTGLLLDAVAVNSNITISGVDAPRSAVKFKSSAGGMRLNASGSSFRSLQVTGTQAFGPAVAPSALAVAGGWLYGGIEFSGTLQRLSMNLSGVSVHPSATAEAVIAFTNGSFVNVSVRVVSLNTLSSPLASLASLRNVGSMQDSSIGFERVVGATRLRSSVFQLLQTPLHHAGGHLWLKDSLLHSTQGLAAVDSFAVGGYGVMSKANVSDLRIELLNSTLSEVMTSVVSLSATCARCSVTIARSIVRGVARVAGTALVTVNSTRPPISTFIDLDNSTIEGFNLTLNYTASSLRPQRSVLLIQSACVVWNTSSSRNPALNATYPVVPLVAISPFERIYEARTASVYVPGVACASADYFQPTPTPAASLSVSLPVTGTPVSSLSQSALISLSHSRSPSQPPPMVLTTAMTLRINGSNWEDVLALGNATIIATVTSFTAAAANVSEDFVRVTRIAIGSLIADVELTYLAEGALPESLLVAAVVANANLTELGLLYHSVTGLGSVVSFSGASVSNATFLQDRTDGKCLRDCQIGVSVGCICFVAMCVAAVLLWHRHQGHIHRVAELEDCTAPEDAADSPVEMLDPDRVVSMQTM